MRNKKPIFIFFIFVLLVLFFSRIGKFIPVVWEVVFNKEISLKKTDSETVNVLLLGVGSGQHEGPGLTDTIMLASMNPAKQTATLVSIPRDLWVPELLGKVNTAYAIGEKKQKNGGVILSKAVVSKVLGQQVDYVFVIDFDGFVKAVDLIGGVDIVVENTFDDYEYPIEEKTEDLCDRTLDEATDLLATQSATFVFPCRYAHVRFDKGDVHMDGKTALTFVRSRYAVGVEGTDFARSRRQQKVISAFKDKMLSAETLLNPIRVANLYAVIADNIKTDISDNEIDDFIKLAQKMRKAKISSYVLDWSLEDNRGLLTHPLPEDFGGSWVLIPKAGDGNFSQIEKYVSCIIVFGTCTIQP